MPSRGLVPQPERPSEVSVQAHSLALGHTLFALILSKNNHRVNDNPKFRLLPSLGFGPWRESGHKRLHCKDEGSDIQGAELFKPEGPSQTPQLSRHT